MELLEAINSSLSGKEDRAGITEFEIWASETRQSSTNDKIAQISNAIEQDEGQEPEFWYYINLAVQRLELKSLELSEQFRALLNSGEGVMRYGRARYYAFTAMGSCGTGLVPNDIVNEKEMILQSPGLWLGLMLEAFGNGDSKLITHQLIELVSSIDSQIAAKIIRSKLAEIREAYPSIPEFRKAIRLLLPHLRDDSDKAILLEAVDRRVGAMIVRIDAKQNRPVRKRVFAISNKTIASETKFNSATAQPLPQVATG